MPEKNLSLNQEPQKQVTYFKIISKFINNFNSIRSIRDFQNIIGKKSLKETDQNFDNFDFQNDIVDKFSPDKITSGKFQFVEDDNKKGIIKIIFLESRPISFESKLKFKPEGLIGRLFISRNVKKYMEANIKPIMRQLASSMDDINHNRNLNSYVLQFNEYLFISRYFSKEIFAQIVDQELVELL